MTDGHIMLTFGVEAYVLAFATVGAQHAAPLRRNEVLAA